MERGDYQKKKSAETPLMNNTSAHTPEARVGQTSNDSIRNPAEKVKEIIDMNNKGKMPEQLEDYAFIKEQRNTEYGEEGQNVDLSKLE
jgi:hypothetical protein